MDNPLYTYYFIKYTGRGTTPLTGERAQATLRGRPRGRLGTVGSGKGRVRGRPRRLGSTQGAGATL
jgi:hypothetical protein